MTTTTSLPTGTWHVDAGTSELGFASRGMFGLVGVKGTFETFDGDLRVTEDGTASGELRIQAASLETKNKKRDEHLRGPDFFDVEASPVVRFALTSIAPAADGTLTVSGTLEIRENRMAVTAPVVLTGVSAERLRLETTLSVDRAEAGVGWSKMGMIKGPAHLRARVELVRS